MKKIALTLGAAVVALTAVNAVASDAHAGGKKGFHFGWHKSWHGAHFHGPKYHCFWKKKKFFTPKGWYWKKVRICKPFHWYY